MYHDGDTDDDDADGDDDDNNNDLHDDYFWDKDLLNPYYLTIENIVVVIAKAIHALIVIVIIAVSLTVVTYSHHCCDSPCEFKLP